MHTTTILNMKSSSHNRHRIRKPSYRQLPKGAVVLIDTSNMIVTIGAAQAARRISHVANTLTKWGYRPYFVWDGSSYRSALRRQSNAFETKDLKEFANRADVILIDVFEADLVLLQAAQKNDNSVIVSNDEFRDYNDMFPSVVATQRRGFATYAIEGQRYLTIFGMPEAIVFDAPVKAQVVANERESLSAPDGDDEWMLENDEDTRTRHTTHPVVVPRRKANLSAVDGCILRGDMQRSYRLISHEAEKSPNAYNDIADFVDDADGIGIFHSAAHFVRLAERGVIKQRECSRRNRRQRAERRRLAYRNVA